MNTSRFIYEDKTKKLFDFKSVYKYTNSYQATYNKVVGFLTKKS